MHLQMHLQTLQELGEANMHVEEPVMSILLFQHERYTQAWS
jgi:hypothetical protein